MDNSLQPLARRELERLIGQIPALPLPAEEDDELLTLLSQENNSTAEIAELIQRNRGLTSRVLRTVNSAYYGLAEPVEDVEEAVLYMGLTQVRRIAMTAPILEPPGRLSWILPAFQSNALWRHGLATAALTQELLQMGSIRIHGDAAYLAGLLHDVGHLVMAAISPERFDVLTRVFYGGTDELLAAEERLYGWNHARIGEHYLRSSPAPAEALDAIAHHHTAEGANLQPQLAAAVGIAEELARMGDFGGPLRIQALSDQAWSDLPAWETVFGSQRKLARVTGNRLRQKLQSLPDLLKGI